MVTRDVTGLSELHALLGEGASFEGMLTFEGRVRIDGTFHGKVQSPGVLILGHHADIDAQIEVGTLIVLGGTLRGQVRATKAVELHPDARVYANVTAPQLMIDRGAVFEGESRRPEGEVDADADAEGAAEPETVSEPGDTPDGVAEPLAEEPGSEGKPA